MTHTRSKRTDVHRPGAIVPAHYTSWVSYSGATSEGGYPIPAIRVDCTLPVPVLDDRGRVTGYRTPTCPDSGRCCVASAERVTRATGGEVFGSRGKCGVCGACYVYGTLFRHDSTGSVVHMGHDCADKYELMADMSTWELENGRIRQALASEIARAQSRAAREEFLDKDPGLREALALGVSGDARRKLAILGDLDDKLVKYRSLTEKQVALALRLADQVSNPPPAREAERHCEAPLGRQDFEGVVVSAKTADGYMGTLAVKITVKVTRDDGATWLAYGTAPRALLDHVLQGAGKVEDLRGRRVEVRATLERPRQRPAGEYETDEARERALRRSQEQHFVFMSRPSACFADVCDHPRREIPRSTRRRRRADQDQVAAPVEQLPWET